MLQRCLVPTHAGYADYGARGISVCERWRDFLTFLADMGERPEGTSIDRIDGSKGYDLGNCRWATPKVQANNQSSNVFIQHAGRNKSISEWAQELGMPVTTLHYRLTHGWTVEKALTTPVR